MLQSDTSALVTLGEEIAFVNNYIALQTTRFQQGLEVIITVPDVYMEKKIVPVTLQVLIENAIKHNIIDPEQALIIEISIVADTWLMVENNVQMKMNMEDSNKQGLNNLRGLYTYYSQLPVIVNMDDNIFSVKIPLL